MKTQLFALISAGVILSSCGGSTETVEATDAQQTVDAQVEKIYKVDTNSVVNWEGFKPTASHTGSFLISEGTINENSNGHLDGNFIIDMKSLQITDGTDDPKLKEHLMGKDFFDVNTYPNSTFTITSLVQGYGDSSKVTGNLELKGVSKSITFPALVVQTDSNINIKADFMIDRTDWNMHYGNDESLKDKFIKPQVRIAFDVNATAE